MMIPRPGRRFRWLLATVAAVALALLPAALAAPTITVPDAVYGGTTVASVTNEHLNDVVFVQCYQSTFGGTYVYAAYFEVFDGQATLGPLASTLWPGGDADCTAQHGWFTGRGFGAWKVIAETTFHVDG